MLSEAEIFTDLIGVDRADFSPTVAREMLTLKFSDNASERIRDLLSKNNAGAITPSESIDLDKYLRVGQFIDVLQAKARLSLTEGRKIDS